MFAYLWSHPGNSIKEQQQFSWLSHSGQCVCVETVHPLAPVLGAATGPWALQERREGTVILYFLS